MSFQVVRHEHPDIFVLNRQTYETYRFTVGDNVGLPIDGVPSDLSEARRTAKPIDKWLELLNEIAPGVTRVAVLRDPAITSGPALFGIIQALAPSLTRSHLGAWRLQ
jgi:hypothetical protein